MKTIRFLTVMLTALSMGAAFAHLLEMPAKLRYDGPTWLHLLQTLYPPGFGTVGAACEVLAVVASLVLVVATRNRRKAFPWTLLGFSCVLASHAIFWIWVNLTMTPLTPDTLVIDWTRLRDQWESAHARFFRSSRSAHSCSHSSPRFRRLICPALTNYVMIQHARTPNQTIQRTADRPYA